ncbi:MAG TPA: caspase family protein [Pyrinomonadaceae bacterium]|jgi:uncharacterized caspase-like protein
MSARLARFSFTSLLLLVMLGSSHARAQDRGLDLSARAAAPGHFYALVIGNNAYQNIPRLQTAEADAREVDAILRTSYGFQTRLLLNAGRQQIISALNAYRRELAADDNLLIYYAGHGVNDREADKAYWLPVDARLDDNSNWISADDITTNVKVIPARHVLIVSDSCYSGTLTRGLEPAVGEPAMRQRYLEKMAAGHSRTLMASGGNEPVADGGGGGHSVFAGALLRGLAQMERPQFTATELFRDFVEQSVAGRAQQTPEYNPLRNSGHEAGDFVFVKTGAQGVATTTQPQGGPPGAARNGGASAPVQGAAPAVDPLAIELSFWETIKNSTDPEDFKAYLARYPNGQFADLARRRAQPARTQTQALIDAATRPEAPASRSGDDAGSAAGSAAGAPPAVMQTVRDYFLWLPEQYLAVPLARRAEVLASGGTVVDTKNGYISFQPSADERTAVAVFRLGPGNHLVAVSAIGSGPAGSRLHFIKREQGRWRDLTAATLPAPFDPALKYELPRFGTTIVVTNRAGNKVYDLVWTDGSFVLKRGR